MAISRTDERRADERLPMREVTRATLRPGCDVSVVDLSPGGALVEARRPLRPGARVHVQVTTSRRSVALSAQVLRCVVWALDTDGVLYRGALQFEDRCLWVREPDAPRGCAVPDHEAGRIGIGGTTLPGAGESKEGVAWKGND